MSCVRSSLAGGQAGTKTLNGTSMCRSDVWEPTTGVSQIRSCDEGFVGLQTGWRTAKGRSLRQERRESYNAAFMALIIISAVDDPCNEVEHLLRRAGVFKKERGERYCGPPF